MHFSKEICDRVKQVELHKGVIVLTFDQGTIQIRKKHKGIEVISVEDSNTVDLQRYRMHIIDAWDANPLYHYRIQRLFEIAKISDDITQ